MADGGLVAEPLGEHTPERLQQIADAVHLSILCATFSRGTNLTALYGTSAAEPFFAMDLPTVTVNLAVLADTLVPAEILAARTLQLRQLGELPEGDYVIGPDGIELPEDVVVEDKLAAIASAKKVVTDDPYVAATAAALGTPVQGPVIDVRMLAKQARAQIDEFAEAAEAALVERGGDLKRRIADLAAENAALRHAHARLRHRMLHERQILVDKLMAADDSEAVERLRAELEHERHLHREALARAAEDHRELNALRQTKLLRWSQPLRDTYGKIRRA
ncbi:hypothetical protein [Kutzneria kofuensis]|uniref:hypothetical protein n=1 Tax=Kutzneria kofuensis TaxID=103725 RepID=UPI0031E6F298